MAGTDLSTAPARWRQRGSAPLGMAGTPSIYPLCPLPGVPCMCRPSWSQHRAAATHFSGCAGRVSPTGSCGHQQRCNWQAPGRRPRLARVGRCGLAWWRRTGSCRSFFPSRLRRRLTVRTGTGSRIAPKRTLSSIPGLAWMAWSPAGLRVGALVVTLVAGSVRACQGLTPVGAMSNRWWTAGTPPAPPRP